MYVLLAMGLLTACEPVETGLPSDVESFVEANVEAYCGKMFACHSLEEIQDDLGFLRISDERSCIEFFGSYEMDRAHAQVARAHKGRLVFEAAQADACVAELKQLTCAEFEQVPSPNISYRPPRCTPFLPSVEDGSSCDGSDECFSGACAQLSEENGSVCIHVPSKGEACTDFCAAGLYCDQVCQPERPNGTTCEHTYQCESQRCSDDGAGSWVCKAPEAD